MSRTAVKAALVNAVSLDKILKTVESADVPLAAQKLPCASVEFDGDETVVGGELTDSRIYRFTVRLYVRLGKDLRVAEAALLQRADALDLSLATSRQLTTTAEVIGRADGTIVPTQWQESVDLLCYEVTIRVEQRAPHNAELTSGDAWVVIRDVTQENYPTQPPELEVIPDELGTLRAYIGRTAAEMRSVSGRIETATEAESLRSWLAASSELAYLDIRGVETSGWHIAGAPASRIARRNLSAETFDIDLTLWRV